MVRAKSMTARDVLARLEELGTPQTVEGMARYAVPNDRAFGVTVRDMRQLAKEIGRDHALALELWPTGWYEARTMAVFVADPERMTRAEADGWVSDMDSWAICDTACFHLFDRTEFAWDAIPAWAAAEEEFTRRAGFALLWALARHDKAALDRRFIACLPLAEQYADDERNFVKKAVDMALRAVGIRNAALNAATIETARRLAGSEDRTAAWIGRHVLKELESDKVRKRLKGGR